jgi:type III secretion protein J
MVYNNCSVSKDSMTLKLDHLGAQARVFSAVWFSLLLAALLFLSACSRQEVYGNLSEAQANELIAALSDVGIAAEKVANEEKWGVSVAQDDFSKAVETLRSAGLPREEYDSLGTVFKKEGFTSTALEERARLNYGLSQELSRTISEIDGVVQARVHLTMPEADSLSEEAKPSAASVFVKYRSGFDLRSQTGSIKSLVTNSIEGLTYERVSVVMVPAKAVAPVPSGSAGLSGDTVLRVMAAILALAALGFGGRALWRARRRRGGLPATHGDG